MIGNAGILQLGAKILFYENLTRIPRFVNGDEWSEFSIELRNRGGDSHEFDILPHLVGGDSRIQAISLIITENQFSRYKSDRYLPR